MTTEIAPITVTDEQVALIKQTIAQGATDAELKLFFYDCRRHGVHPLDKMLHFTKRKGKYTPITSIDLMRTQAAETGEMAGSDDPVFGEDDSDRWARVTVYRLTSGQRFPYTATARWSEYYPGDGEQGFMWRKMPKTMLGKCAEALALRKAFPKQLQGLYAAEEMHQAGAHDRPNNPPTTLRAAIPDADGVIEEEPPQLSIEDEERKTLLTEATRLSRVLKLTAQEKAAFRLEFLGSETADVMNADIGALLEMVKALKKREPKA